jgi:UDPglucose 6-dehydrogenase
VRIVDAAIEANTRRREVILQKIENACGGSVARRRLAVLGLTFKADTDDVRESPSIELIRALSQRGAKVRAYDPSQPLEAVRLLPDVRMTTTVLGAVKSADALLVLTDWKSFSIATLANWPPTCQTL